MTASSLWQCTDVSPATLPCDPALYNPRPEPRQRAPEAVDMQPREDASIPLERQARCSCCDGRLRAPRRAGRESVDAAPQQRKRLLPGLGRRARDVCKCQQAQVLPRRSSSLMQANMSLTTKDTSQDSGQRTGNTASLWTAADSRWILPGSWYQPGASTAGSMHRKGIAA